MKEAPKKPYRFYRPRRPEGIGSGLRLDGVTHIFGLVGAALLVLIGVAMLLVRDSVDEKALLPIEVVLQATPYQSNKLRNSILLSVTDARVVALDYSAYMVADKKNLMSLKKGDVLIVGMPVKDANKWNRHEGRKDYFKAMTLQKKGGASIVTFNDYNQKAKGFSSQGWWVVLLGLIFVPYQLISNPRFPVWAALGLYLLALLIYFLV